MHSKRIEITGIIAAGKTTLARALADAGAACAVFESFATNPFYDAFYREPSRYSFETEVTFLLQHYHDARNPGADPECPLVCDFSFELDAAYAATTLSEAERRTFAAVHEHVVDVLLSPALIVALKCSPRESLRRIRRRARPAEQSITVQYLEALAQAIDVRLSSAKAVLEIDSEGIDFSAPGKAQESVIRYIVEELQTGH